MNPLWRTCFAALAAATCSAGARADVVLKEDFESPARGWQKRLRGKGTIELAPGGVSGKCLKITSRGAAMAYYSIFLDPARVRGKRLVVTAKVKLDHVQRGKQRWCCAKIHVGAWEKGKLLHRPKLLEGTFDWREVKLVAPIPAGADRVQLDLGIQMAAGTAYFDDVLVDDGLKPLMPLPLDAAANTSMSDGVAGDGRGGFIDAGALDLRDFPAGDVKLGGVDFYVLKPGENSGAACVVLRGRKRPAFPLKAAGPIPVGRKAKGLFFLQAAAWVEPGRREPCLVYAIRYRDGKTLRLPMREGVDIGSFLAPKDLPNWKVVWRSRRPGADVGVGVTAWKNPRPDVAIESISLSSPGQAAVPIVLAITLDRRSAAP